MATLLVLINFLPKEAKNINVKTILNKHFYVTIILHINIFN